MEFGRLAPKDLENAQLQLPADDEQTQRVLGKKKKAATPKVYAGCAKWGRKDWIGKIYPQGTKEKDFLELYAKQFNCIEFNAIFYRLPTAEQVQTWKSKVGADFQFCPKFTDKITHIRRLKNAQKDVDEFLESISGLGNNLGPIFLMPHPQMGPKHFDTIREFIESLPKDIDLFVELRHPEWFLPENAEKIFGLLEKMKVGSVITDTAGRRDCVHMRLTTPDAFIRFVGNSLHPTDYQRIDEWVQRIKKWLENGLERCYFFMHQHDELYSPELVKYLIEELNRHCNLDIHVPEFATEEKKISKPAPRKKAK
jgi:uncharacterized protein YecE (DUF72 family)